MAKRVVVEKEHARRVRLALKKLDKISKDVHGIATSLMEVADVRGATASLIGLAVSSTDAAADALGIDLEHIERNARS